MDNNYTRCGNDNGQLLFILARLGGGVNVEAAEIGHTELCRLLLTLAEFLQPTGYLQLLDGTFLRDRVSLQPPTGAGAKTISLA